MFIIYLLDQNGQKEVLGEALECLSLLVNDQDSHQIEIERLVLDENSWLDMTLTAITLPDGTQAFVTSDLDSDGNIIAFIFINKNMMSKFIVFYLFHSWSCYIHLHGFIITCYYLLFIEKLVYIPNNY